MPKKPVFLKTEEDFGLFKKSRSLVSNNLRIRWHVPKSQNHTRFGFIVPKKVIKNVTDRNTIKRRLKSIFSKHLDHLSPVDILVFPKFSSVRIKFSDLENEVVGIFKQARIYGSNYKNK
jgi:ribonuclease P protein component